MQVKVGDHAFVRSNTGIDYLGKVVSIDGPFTVTMDQVAWVAIDGGCSKFHTQGRTEQMEIEPMGDGWTINWSAVRLWPHPLIKERH